MDRTFSSVVVPVLRAPLSSRTWREAGYLLAALPVALVCIPLALVGGPAGRIQRDLVARLLGRRIEPPKDGRLAALAHAVLSLPLAVAGLAVTVYGWSLVPLNLGWPLRPLLGMGTGDYSDAWGGPTFAGAWALHALVGGVGFLLLMPWIGRGLTALQGRLAAGLLGPRRIGPGRAALLALPVTAVAAVVAVPIVHQL
ncbi:hypothetical protein AB0D08_40865 [Kitasatospora sp. NPDC048540]|uniref:hypothetical protein n=1 Tax=Kitasatospora sp. NPDC048540 TaxID=3155634 RepID=UPI0033F5D845